MEKVRPCCGQPNPRIEDGERTEQEVSCFSICNLTCDRIYSVSRCLLLYSKKCSVYLMLYKPELKNRKNYN